VISSSAIARSGRSDVWQPEVGVAHISLDHTRMTHDRGGIADGDDSLKSIAIISYAGLRL
jgi:hypothetical protein